MTVLLACALAATLHTVPSAAGGAAAAGASTPLTITSARVSLDGTSNIHPYTASSSTVRVITLEIAGAPASDLLDRALLPGGLTALEVAIPVTSLTSPRDGVDKNMHKALKATEFADIRFRLRAIESAAVGHTAAGWLTVAGVEKPVTLVLKARRDPSTLTVTATTDLVMTDFGVTPPKAMMGMLKTDPKIQIRIELVLSAPSLT